MITEEKINEMTQRITKEQDRFYKKLHWKNRKWFTKKIIRQLWQSETYEPQVENDVKGAIRAAKELVIKFRRDKIYLSGQAPDSGGSRTNFRKKHLDQIVYGAIGVHFHQLLTEIKQRSQDESIVTYNEPLLKNVLSRRLRIVDRLYFDVLHGSMFEYPEDVGVTESRPNEVARDYWEPISGQKYFLSNRGRANPKDAISKLFTRYSNSEETKRNLFYCQQVAMILQMDSLLALQDDSLINKLSSINSGYFRIDYPVKEGEADEGDITKVYLTNDLNPQNDSDRQLIERGSIDFDDLQVGDQVYFANHPIYSLIAPDDVWSGEYAFVLGKPKGEYNFAGHGVTISNVENFTKMMHEELNDYIADAQDVVLQHWNSDKEIDSNGNEVSKLPSNNGTATVLKTSYGGELHRSTARESQLPDNKKFASWFIWYGTEEYFLFKMNGKENKIQLVDMPKNPIASMGGLTPKDVYVIRPLVGASE
ncbi:MAG: hypothetical protein ACFFD4_37260 [Candidatus Odinarchaeota archaeon]